MPNKILQKLDMLKGFAGYLGAGVFTPDGQMLGGVTEVSGINFEIAGSLFHDAMLFTNNITREAGFGYTDMMQINTQSAVVLGKCVWDDDAHFHTIMVVKSDCNLAMAKLMLKRFNEALKIDFKEDT